ncbi:hypothetical protein, partial [Streptococcus suis]|uniref:hypothetical protein n=2 Tax=Streptococcus suis TaxID=1307 RepID=UPI001EE6B2CE
RGLLSFVFGKFLDYCKVPQKHVEPTASHKRILVTSSPAACTLLRTEVSVMETASVLEVGTTLG